MSIIQNPEYTSITRRTNIRNTYCAVTRVSRAYWTRKYGNILEWNTLRVIICTWYTSSTSQRRKARNTTQCEILKEYSIIYTASSVGSICRYSVYQQAKYYEYSLSELYSTRDPDTEYHPRVSIEPKHKHTYNTTSMYREYELSRDIIVVYWQQIIKWATRKAGWALQENK